MKENERKFNKSNERRQKSEASKIKQQEKRAKSFVAPPEPDVSKSVEFADKISRERTLDVNIDTLKLKAKKLKSLR